ncbi:anthranilate synthase component I family protein [Paenibacillus gansuensis]|uniref:Anthranilate synthase component I family protein n=1 Tax=Paenibacillus gansuensis TaxID=306542 RepID=A0ABW5P9E1_9BACL
MSIVTLAHWKEWALTYKWLPYIERHELKEGGKPLSWEKVWAQAGEEAVILESGKDGRYTYAAVKARMTIRGKGDTAESCHTDPVSGRTVVRKHHTKPLEAVKTWMAPYRTPKVEGAPKFIGGCIGYWSYDIIRSIEKLPLQAKDDLPFPDYFFMMVEELWILDEKEQALYCAVHQQSSEEESLEQSFSKAAQRASDMKKRWDEWTAVDPALEQSTQAKRDLLSRTGLGIDVEQVDGVTTVFTKERFMQAVLQIQEYISQGDVFQVNLSVRQSRPLITPPEEIYEWLRLFNPSPYMGLLRFDGMHLVSASPELLVETDGETVSTRPIAGTRRRGRTEQEDAVMAEELRSSEKERAEHIMLVDLERNDLGRISEYGSVQVEDLMVIEYYSHVMHLVSEIKGRLADGKDAYDVIAASFPGGTITGAPKIRTMEIIEELEPTRRGPYTGSIGWIDYNGNMEFNITIRTLAVAGGMGHIQAGAGIVIDSDPEREYYESLSKAKALWKAIQYSELYRKQSHHY